MPVVYAVLTVLLWPIPLLGLLHVESSAVLAFAAYFIAGLSSLTLFGRNGRLRSVLLMQELALLVPGLLLTITLLWRPNCGYAQGLLFFLLFPMVTVTFAVGLAYLLDALNLKRKRGILIGVGVLVCIVGPIYDIGFHPQFFTYNHVFGGVLGPVYDEELAIRGGLFAFRGLTLIWSTLFVLVGGLIHRSHRANIGRSPRRWNLAGIGVAAILIFLSYVFAGPLGINTTIDEIRAELSGRVATEHFEIFFSPEQLSLDRAQLIAEDHEYRYHVLSEELDVEIEGRIQSFVYPDPDVKAELTGARLANVAPVWLAHPQMHILASRIDHVLTHELAHVFSREFGLPVVRASVSVGLLEGLAVSLEPPDGLPHPHEQVSAALLGTPSEDLVLGVAAHVSPWGFWTGRGAVSYTTMGSFVAYLLEAYGPGPLKDAYAWADFERGYGKSVNQLAEEWTAMLMSLRVTDASSGRLVSARFAVPSLFEKVCPHYVPPYRKEYGEAVTAMVKEDSAKAFRHARRAVELEPRHSGSLDLWARLALSQNLEAEVLGRIGRLAPDSMTASLFERAGDALALSGDSVAALKAYESALHRLPSFAHEARSRLALRMLTAARPGVVRMLVYASPDADVGDGPAVSLARALAYARQHRYEQAARVLRTTAVTLEPGMYGSEAFGHAWLQVRALRTRRLVWLARFTYRSGEPGAAAEFAAEAADLYRRKGAFNEASAIDDFREKMLWIVSRDSSTSRRSANV